MPRVRQTRCGVGEVSIRSGTTSLFVCGAVEDGNKFGRRKGVGGVGGVCGIMGCDVGGNGIDREQRCHEAAAQEKALADNTELQCCRESAARAVELAELVSAVEQSRQKSADRLAVSAERTLADKRCRQKEAERGKMLGETALAAEQHCSLLAAQAAESALATERVVVSADLLLPEPALAKDKRRQEETAKNQRRTDDEHIMVPVLPPDPGNMAIRYIQVECTLLAAPLDAILAEIERDNIPHEARAPPMTTSPHPAAMLSTPPPPYDLRGLGPFYNGGEHSRDIPCSGTVGYTIAYH
jgi:hypothetical protein